MLVHESLQSFEIRVNGMKCESVWCKIASENGEFITVGSFYRPPDPHERAMFSLFDVLSSIDTPNLVLGGDFNFPDVE